MKWSLVCARGCKLKAKDPCKVRPLGKRGIYVDYPGSPLSSLAGAAGHDRGWRGYRFRPIQGVNTSPFNVWDIEEILSLVK
jgi:hypothetical protein